jgi:hypothetical protein
MSVFGFIGYFPPSNADLGGNSRTEAGDHSFGAIFDRTVVKCSLQCIKDHCTGDIAVVFQSGSAVTEFLAVDSQVAGKIVQDSRPSGMDDVEIQVRYVWLAN